jgi:cytidylate kinase
MDEAHALACVRKAVETAYQTGNFVIVGRGGQMILKDRPGVLHVRIQSGLEERLLRVRSTPEFTRRKFNDSVEERRAAQHLIETHDLASAAYLKRFYGVDWTDLSLYHIVINTGKMSLERASQLIVQAVGNT